MDVICSQKNLGDAYRDGRGVEKDDKEAVNWYRKAAEQGDATAQFKLGLMYEEGRGIEQYYEQAVFWYQQAAEQGYTTAQCSLERICQKARYAKPAGEWDEAKLVPILARVMDIAFRMGYHQFKENARFVLAQIRKNFGDEAADAMTLRHVKAAYNFMAEGKEQADTEEAVAAVKSLDEIIRGTNENEQRTESGNTTGKP